MNSSFKSRLKQLEKLARDAKDNLWERAIVIRDLVNDKEAMAFCNCQDAGAMRDFLATFVSDVHCSIDDLLVMIDFAPDREEWTAKTVEQLRLAAYSARGKIYTTAETKPRSSREETLMKRIEKIEAEKAELAKRLHDTERELKICKRRLQIIESAMAAPAG